TIPADDRLPSLAEPVAVVCNSGHRSSLGASLLRRRGLRAVNVVGGTTAWADSGRPLGPPS
ncbi:MAG TPA: rhodanese-like domain-containing protein, partial [Trebonia sp.]